MREVRCFTTKMDVCIWVKREDIEFQQDNMLRG